MRLALLLAWFLALTSVASAHVSVLPAVARPGDTVELTFRVPNERDDAATTGLQLFLPKGIPAKVVEHPGWTADNKGTGEIAWTPDTPASAIAPGRTQDFKVTVGPLPQSDRVVFKALQTYADGQIVRWIQDSGPDDERPAAILDLSGNGGSASGGAGAALIIAVVAIPLIALVVIALLVTRRRRRDS
jgi:periplasmic copper chaperone A